MEKGLLATLAGAVLAALGYVGKQLADLVTAYMATRRMRRAQLLRLYSLLRTGRVIFDLQNDLTRALSREIAQNHPEASSPELAGAGLRNSSPISIQISRPPSATCTRSFADKR